MSPSSPEMPAKVVFAPRLTPIVAAWLVLLSACLWLESSASLSWLERAGLRSVLAHERDDYGYILYRTASMPESEGIRIVAAGGSTLREGFLADALTTRQLQETVDPAITFQNLSSFSQTMAETLQIFETLLSRDSLQSGDVFVVGINPRRFGALTDDLRNVFTSPRLPLLETAALRDVLEDAGEGSTWRPMVWKLRTAARSWIEGRVSADLQTSLSHIRELNCDFSCLGTLLHSRWLKTPRRYFQYAYPNTALPMEQKEAIADEVRSIRVDQVRKGALLSLSIAKEIVALGRENDIDVVFLELPRDPLSYTAYESVAELYLNVIEELKRSGGHYVDLTDKRRFVSADFHDLDHILASRRPAITSGFARSLKEASLL